MRLSIRSSFQCQLSSTTGSEDVAEETCERAVFDAGVLRARRYSERIEGPWLEDTDEVAEFWEGRVSGKGADLLTMDS